VTRILHRHEVILLIIIVIYTAGVTVFNPAFGSPSTLIRVLNSSVVLSLVALGSTVVMLTRNIDVSVGSTLGLSAAVCATMVTDGHSLVLVIPLVLALGILLGAINGAGVAFAKVPAIVMTLGTLGAYRGLQYMYTDGKSIEEIDARFKALAGYDILGIPMFVWLAMVIVIGAHLMLTRTRSGRWIHATGDNPIGAHLIGIPTRAVTVVAFAVAGLMAALGGIFFASQIGFVTNQTGMGIEIRAIAAGVIGGVSLLGGVGTVIGAALGAILLTLITTSLLFLGVPGFWSDAVIGAILLVALLVDARLRVAVNRKEEAERV
jgi:AI-2 transport system permease protein